MRLSGEFFGFGIGVLAAAALVGAAPGASDPPANGQHAPQQHGHGPAQPQGAQGNRWQAPAEYVAAHSSEEAHGNGHGAGPEIAFRGCAYFDGANFAGRRGEIREGVSVEWLGRNWSDRISSTACHPGCRLIGYVDINYGGPRRNFSGAVAALDPAWNDRISALRAVCDGGPGHQAPAESH